MYNSSFPAARALKESSIPALRLFKEIARFAVNLRLLEVESSRQIVLQNRRGNRSIVISGVQNFIVQA